MAVERHHREGKWILRLSLALAVTAWKQGNHSITKIHEITLEKQHTRRVRSDDGENDVIWSGVRHHRHCHLTNTVRLQGLRSHPTVHDHHKSLRTIGTG